MNNCIIYNSQLKKYNKYKLIELLDSKQKIVDKNKSIKNYNVNNILIYSIQDILNLINQYPKNSRLNNSIEMEMLHNIKEPLIKLNNMIGMESVKKNIIYQILYYIQGFHKMTTNYNRESRERSENNDYLHTIIYGPPGTGKTEIARLIGDIFRKIGILKNDRFRKVTRADLIAGYLGQTAIKTKGVIKDCLGGVLFIDEAYSLGSPDQRDSFSKECIDTLCESLSYYKNDIMVIIAGYKNELNTCFFNYNKGLESRFTWSYKTEEYTPNQLKKIFKKMIIESGWKHNLKITDKWFDKHKNDFKSFGRDMEQLFAKTKICHSNRVFGMSCENRGIINDKDINLGFELFLDNKKDETCEKYNETMYI